MKFIIVDEILYSLENVKRVFTEIKFISDHTPFFYINIDYTDGTRYTIGCGSNEEGRMKVTELFHDVANILRGFNIKKSDFIDSASSVEAFYNQIDPTEKKIQGYKLEGVKELKEKLKSLPDNAIYKYQIDNIITEMENRYNALQ